MTSLGLNKHKKLALKTILVKETKKKFFYICCVSRHIIFNLLFTEVTLVYIMQVS